MPKPGRYELMPTAKARSDRRDRHAAEVEASQCDLRASIAETKRLVGQSEEMLRRHRDECDNADGRRIGD